MKLFEPREGHILPERYRMNRERERERGDMLARKEVASAQTVGGRDHTPTHRHKVTGVVKRNTLTHTGECSSGHMAADFFFFFSNAYAVIKQQIKTCQGHIQTQKHTPSIHTHTHTCTRVCVPNCQDRSGSVKIAFSSGVAVPFSCHLLGQVGIFTIKSKEHSQSRVSVTVRNKLRVGGRRENSINAGWQLTSPLWKLAIIKAQSSNWTRVFRWVGKCLSLSYRQRGWVKLDILSILTSNFSQFATSQKLHKNLNAQKWLNFTS